MRAYIIRRLLILVPTLFLITAMVFFLVNLVPGDIVDAMRGQALDVQIDRAAIEKKFGLDRPMIIQYLSWLGIVANQEGKFSGILQGDFGLSWWQSIPVAKLISPRWPITLELGILAILFAQLIALPIGIISALRQDTAVDYVGRSLAILMLALPSFWLGSMIIVFPALWWGYMPPIMYVKITDNLKENLQQLVVPAIVMGMSMGGMTMRMMRTMMLEVQRQDYIRTAWSKGLRESVVVLRHALRNAFIPVITLIGLQTPVLIGGTVVIERIFSLPGMGRLLMAAIDSKDHPLVMGIVVLFGVVMVFINLIVDLTYAWLDPTVKYN
ncbi:MAG: ABC transporter permease [Spirochaetales bacterium]|nr:ABC transporter permease [Spirochaetales bacterium]